MDLFAQVVDFVLESNAHAFLVGGLVRDWMLKRSVGRDIDLAVQGDAKSLARAFADAMGGAYFLLDAEHNVARSIVKQAYVDFAELRGDILSDLATRDFTVNAMALPILRGRRLNPSEPMTVWPDLVDPYHGRDDLDHHRIRAVADNVFRNDPIRLVRAVRLARELGFDIEPRTQALMLENATRLAQAPMERARDEFCKILSLPGCVGALRELERFGLMDALLPAVAALRHLDQSDQEPKDALERTFQIVGELETMQSSNYQVMNASRFSADLKSHFERIISADRTRGLLLRLVALLLQVRNVATSLEEREGRVPLHGPPFDSGQLAYQALQRLRFSKDEVELARTIVTSRARPADLAGAGRMKNREVYRFFRDTGSAGIDVCMLALADVRGNRGLYSDLARLDVTRVVETLLEGYFVNYHTMIAPRPLLNGRTLMDIFGLSPGPQIGSLLEAVREAQVEGLVRTREDALEFARNQLSSVIT